MLLNLRGGLDSLLVKLLLGVLIAAFAIWGIGPSVFNSSNQTVAAVGDAEVTAQEYFNQVQQRTRQLQAQFGAQVDSNQIIHDFGVGQQVLNQLITSAALDNAASNLGMRASDDHVADEIASIDAFKLPDGTFSQEMVDQALQSAGLTRQQLITDVRRTVTRSQLIQSMLAATPISKSLAENLFVYQAERRRAELITIKASEIVDIPEPDPETLTAYYELQKDTYKTPPRRSYQYLLVTPDQFTNDVEVTEEDIQYAYEDGGEEYVKPELRAIEQVTLPDTGGCTGTG